MHRNNPASTWVFHPLAGEQTQIFKKVPPFSFLCPNSIAEADVMRKATAAWWKAAQTSTKYYISWLRKTKSCMG